MSLQSSLINWIFLPRFKWQVWSLICIVVLIACYALLGFKILPHVLKTRLPELIAEKIHRSATIQDISFNPFKLKFTLNGLELRDQNQQPFVKLDELLVDINVRESIKNLGVVVEQLRLTNPMLVLAILKNGAFNFTDLLGKQADQQGGSSLPNIPLSLKKLQLIEGQLSWRDERSEQAETETLSGINITLDNLSNIADEVAKLSLSTANAGDGQIADQTDLTLDKQSMQGNLHLNNISLPRLWTLLLKDQANYVIAQGETDISFNYDLSYKDSIQLRITDASLINRNIQISALDNPEPVISLPELSCKNISFDWAKQELQIGKIEAKRLNLKTFLNPTGEFNYQTLFANKAVKDNTATTSAASNVPDTSKAKPWLINVAEFSLEQGQIQFADRNPTKPYEASLADLSLNLNHYQLHYLPQNLQMQLSSSKLQAHDINLNGFKFAAEKKALQMQLQELNLGLGAYQFAQTDTLQITTHEGSLGLLNLRFSEQDAENPLVTIADLYLQGAELDLAKQQLAIQWIQSTNSQVRAWLDSKGQLNYQTLLAGAPAPVQASVAETTPLPQTASPTVAPSWNITLDELLLKNYQLDLQDNKRSKPVLLSIAPLDLQVKQITNQPGVKLPFTLNAKVNKKGSIKITGSAGLEPLQTEAQINLNAVGLEAFQPYLNDYARVDVVDGALNTALKVKLSKKDAKTDLQLNAQGTASVQDLVTRDQILNKDLIKWRAVKLETVNFDLTPLNLNIGNILVQDPYARVTIKKDRSMNFADVVIQQPAPKEAESKATVASNTLKPRYNINAVTISGGSSDFSDFSLILPFVVQLNDLNGAIKSIASEQRNFSNFNLAGKVFDLSPMNIEGKFKPGNSDLDVAMHFKGMPLPFISPYMVEFAGYKIEKGKMSLDLLYKVAERQLTAENNMVLDQLTLGEKVENPKATSLPLNLAIALLKDSSGKININMPIEGSLDDPQFSIGPLLWDAFTNIITRVVTSPFTALSSLMSSDADMSKVKFKEGSDTLSKEQLTQLEQLAKGLAQKPDLSIEIKGCAYEKQDWPAMQDDALNYQLKTIKAAELSENGQQKSAEHIELSEDESQRLRADLLVKKLPHLAKRTFLGKPELIGSNKDLDSVAKRELAAMIPPDRQRLTALAGSRARNIAQYLIQSGGIAHERVYILDSEVKADVAPGELTSDLALKVE